MMDKKRISILSNVTVDMIVAKLSRKYDVVIPEGYDAWVQEVLNSDSDIYTSNCQAIFVLLDGTESKAWKDYSEGYDRISMWMQAVSYLVNKANNVPVFVSTLDIQMNRICSMSERSLSYRLEDEWNKHIESLLNENKNCFIYDLKDVIMDVGRSLFYSDKMWYMGNVPFGRDGIKRIAEDIDCLVTRFYTAAKKIIVLDLDNTLWGGVIGEDGLEGIQLSNHKEGQRFYDFQRQLLEMKKRGILLAINSKNNLEDVKNVFDNHPYMLLKWDDFVNIKVNWDSKAINIKKMEEELKLTEASFVFVDDNPIEREVVQGECPEVTVLPFPEDTTQLIQFSEKFYRDFFLASRVLEEDAKKTDMYIAEKKRNEDFSSAISIDDYIRKLEMEADIHLMSESEQERVTQLCNKTNQFNVTTRRYSALEIADFAKDCNTVIFTVNAKDKYGDSGLVSVMILRLQNDEVYIDSFLMSCRVMGRNLENVMVSRIFSEYAKKGYKKVKAEYIQSAKNAPVKNLYDRLGFAVVEDCQTEKKYELDLTNWVTEPADTYKKVVFSAEC